MILQRPDHPSTQRRISLRPSTWNISVTRPSLWRLTCCVWSSKYILILSVCFHPSLLPAFPGLDAQGQAFAHGVRVSGCTVHLVDEGLDSGPIVVQRTVAVEDGETAERLAARILVEEHRAYPEALRHLLGEPWRLDERRIIFG